MSIVFSNHGRHNSPIFKQEVSFVWDYVYGWCLFCLQLDGPPICYQRYRFYNKFIIRHATSILSFLLCFLLLVLWQIVEEIKSQNKDAHLKVFQVDISSFQSILNFKGCLQRWLLDSNMDSSIQLLINNAGILATSCRFTAEGYDQ